MFDMTTVLLSGREYSTERSGSQLYVSWYGQTLLDTAVGARNETDQMTSHTAILWVCSGKPLVLLALFQVLAESGLDERTRVADVLPEFADGGKGAVTVADLLTHTVPYRSIGMH